jgi:EAL domain-containing protein (putative c-di-GMP-specific phosphodiesterase class I)
MPVFLVSPGLFPPVSAAIATAGASRPDNARRERPRERRELLQDLRLALAARDQLRLVYQPRIDLAENRCVSAEALLRWRHPTRGAVPPGDFIPLVEDDPLIVLLTDWVLERAISFAAHLAAVGQPLRISVNVSPVNLTTGYFAGRLVEMLSRHNLDPRWLELEFTERTLISDSERTRQQLNQIRRLGLSIAIDDFGAGYSNLSYFHQVPADVLKIDRSLVNRIGADSAGDVVISWIIKLAQELRLRVVAEGIDTHQKAAVLTRWGCHEGQGFAIARPLSQSRLPAWFSRYNSRLTANPSVIRLFSDREWDSSAPTPEDGGNAIAGR